jgi:hypothetical protein
MQAMDDPPEVTGDRTAWEPALSYRLPENPSLELLQEAHAQVLQFLGWVMNDAAPNDQTDFVPHEINRAAVRLIQISRLLPDALTSAVDAQLAKDRAERYRERAEKQGLRLVTDQHRPKPR